MSTQHSITQSLVLVFSGLLLTSCMGNQASLPHQAAISVTKTLSRAIRVRIEQNGSIYKELRVEPKPMSHEVFVWTPPINSRVRITVLEGTTEPQSLEFVAKVSNEPRAQRFDVFFGEEIEGIIRFNCLDPDRRSCS